MFMNVTLALTVYAVLVIELFNLNYLERVKCLIYFVCARY